MTRDSRNGIHYQPPPLAVLASAVQHADSSIQWDFVNITLEVLFETYQNELNDAAGEHLRNASRRAKLARWQRATGTWSAAWRPRGCACSTGPGSVSWSIDSNRS